MDSYKVFSQNCRMVQGILWCPRNSFLFNWVFICEGVKMKTSTKSVLNIVKVKSRWAVVTRVFKDLNRKCTVLPKKSELSCILDNKILKSSNLYKKTCFSRFYNAYTRCNNMADEKRLCSGNIVGDCENHYLNKNQVFTKVLNLQYLYNEAVVQTNKLNLSYGNVAILIRSANFVFICVSFNIVYSWECSDSYYSITICSYVISWYKAVDQKCRILSLIIAVIRIVIAQIAALILARSGRNTAAAVWDTKDQDGIKVSSDTTPIKMSKKAKLSGKLDNKTTVKLYKTTICSYLCSGASWYLYDELDFAPIFDQNVLIVTISSYSAYFEVSLPFYEFCIRFFKWAMKKHRKPAFKFNKTTSNKVTIWHNAKEPVFTKDSNISVCNHTSGDILIFVTGIYTLIARIGFKRALAKLSILGGFDSMRLLLSHTIVVDMWYKTICCFISSFECIHEKFDNHFEYAKSSFGITKADSITSFITLKSGEASLKNSILISVKSDGDHKSRIRSELRTNYGGLKLTSEFVRSLFISIILATIVIILKLGGAVILMYRKPSQKVSLTSYDFCARIRALKKHRIRASRLKEDMHFAARLILAQKDPDHLWSSCRNFNEVKYALHLCKDDKSRVLFDKPIVWPVTHLVLTMNQMLTGPGKK